MDKKAIREQFRAKRASLTAEARVEASRRIAARLLELPEVAQAGSVFCYVSLGDEVDTLELLQRWLGMGVAIGVPAMQRGGIMHAAVIRSLGDLKPGMMGILSPPEDAPVMAGPELCIVPGVAFARDGFRVGQAGGYYDRYLADRPETLTVGLAFACQVLDRVPVEPHDKSVDFIVTESETIDVRAARRDGAGPAR